MRESLFVAREKTKNSLESQQELTEHTLRKRIFDTQRTRNEFEWQIIKVRRKKETNTHTVCVDTMKKKILKENINFNEAQEFMRQKIFTSLKVH